jgi:hypothetical protein
MRDLRRLQRTHRFYLKWGNLPSYLLGAFGILFGMYLESRGARTAAITVALSGLGVGFAVGVYYFVNAYQLRSWRCPKCGCPWKDNSNPLIPDVCEVCGYRLNSPNR